MKTRRALTVISLSAKKHVVVFRVFKKRKIFDHSTYKKQTCFDHVITSSVPEEVLIISNFYQFFPDNEIYPSFLGMNLPSSESGLETLGV